ncbi:MucBP domain-containing protein, partial [Listeria booriae]
MSTNQKGKKRQVWMSLGLAGVLVTNGSLPYAVPANEVQAVETTQSERETKVTTIPAGSTFASIFPSYKLALQVAMEIYPQTRPDKIDVKKEVTQAELDRVTIIEDDPALGDPIGNIEGVQYLRNLEDLWVGIAGDFRGKVENLDVLSNLTKLKVLAVKNQALSDISGLKNLTNLTYLNLTDNKITDAGPIAGLTKLEFISLYVGNEIQSLEPFRQLTHLKKLYLSASVSDFRPLQHLPLIQDPGSTWQLWGEVKLPDAYVGEPVFMQAFDPMGEQVMFGGVTVDGKWEGMEAYDGKYATYSKAGMGKVSFGQSPPGSSGSRRFISVDFKQRVLPAKATVQPVTVRYVDEKGEVLAPEERLTGVLGEAYEAQAKTINGYQLTEEPANRVGTFSTEAQTVTFVYTKETKVTTIPAGSTYRSLFPDKKLAVTVAKQIYPFVYFEDLDLDQEVTQEELNRVTEIIEDWDITENPMRNIEGVQYLHNLKRLYIGDSGGWSGVVENLDRLAGLDKLERLSIVNNKVQDISGIKNLTNLTYLNLTDNKITDAGPIAGLTKLEFISLYVGNNIQSLAPFQQLAHLKKLYLSASVSDFRPLQHLPLIQDASNTWELRGEVQLPDAYVGEPVFMQAFDPTGQQVAYGSVYLDDKWQGLDAYQNNHVIWTKQGTVGSVTFTQRPVGATDYSRYIRVDFKQRVLPAKATVQPVTVRYVDDQGEVLAPEKRLTGVLGEAYEAQAKPIDGYQLTEEPANRVGTFSTEAQTVTFVYTKETKVTTIPAGSTYRSLFPDKKLAVTVAKQIYPFVYFEDLDLDQEVTQEELNRVTEIIEDWDITE